MAKSQKPWWESGWWSVAGTVLAVIFGTVTCVGLLKPDWFKSLGQQMSNSPTEFAVGTAWVALVLLAAVVLFLSVLLWLAVQKVGALRAEASALSPAGKTMFFGEIVEGTFNKSTKLMALQVTVQNPGSTLLTVHSVKSSSVSFANAEHDVGWNLEGAPLRIEPFSAAQLKLRGTFGKNLTHTLSGKQSVRCIAIKMRGELAGGDAEDIPIYTPAGFYNLQGQLSVVDD